MEFSNAMVECFSRQIEGCRLYPNVVPATEQSPYAFYTETMRPITTKDGIAGYDSTSIITVVAAAKSEAQNLASQVERLFHAENVGGQTMWLTSVEYTFYEKERLHAYELTFNINQI